MRMGFVKHKSIAPLLIAVSLATAPGCKSGWKMPSPSSMWPWSKQPSAETLAGTPPAKPTIESPSTKYTPSAVASVAAGGGTKSATTAPGSTGYPTASLASTPAKPSYGGAAAGANGYQIGPYGMSGQAGQTAQAGVQTPPATSTAYGAGAQVPGNVYAGTAGLPSHSLPPSGTPNVSSPYSPPVSGIAQAGGTAAATAPSSPYSMPNATPHMGSSMPQFQPNVPMPGSPTNSAVAFPSTPYPGSAATAPSLPPLPPSSYAPAPGASLPPAGGSSYPMPNATTPVASPADSYRPGSTGRVGNSYNFSTGSATVPVNSGSYAPSQPTTAPSTPGYGSFQLPPNTANAGSQVVR